MNVNAGVMGNCCLVTDFLATPTDHTECFAKWHYRKNSTFQTVKHRHFGSEHAHELSFYYIGGTTRNRILSSCEWL